jgi:hypothetical protein
MLNMVSKNRLYHTGHNIGHIRQYFDHIAFFKQNQYKADIRYFEPWQ